jgi:hyperosmotically inducible periplasmic protein
VSLRSTSFAVWSNLRIETILGKVKAQSHEQACFSRHALNYCKGKALRIDGGGHEMNRSSKRWKGLTLLGVSLVLGGSLVAGSVRQGQQSAPDNTKTNQGDANKGATTADQQKMNPTDRNITKQIRSSIYKDKSLSTYAHNIKIISQDGKVTLKGPVRSEDEKINIEAKAAAVAGAANVTSQLEVAPEKQS